MGALAALDGKIVYLDANIVIYAVEGFAPLAAAIRELFEAIDAGSIGAVTSELTLAEVLVEPFQLDRPDLAELYRNLLEGAGHLRLVPLDRMILVDAARLRASLGLRLPDARHVASAVISGCAGFVSNDLRLSLPQSLIRVRLG